MLERLSLLNGAAWCCPKELAREGATFVLEAKEKDSLLSIQDEQSGGRAFAHEWLGWKRTGLRITIADNGTGIAPKVFHRLKEPFFTTKGAAGNGMGLAVVQEIIIQNSGIFKIRSCVIPGRTGTVMTMFLPSAVGS